MSLYYGCLFVAKFNDFSMQPIFGQIGCLTKIIWVGIGYSMMGIQLFNLDIQPTNLSMQRKYLGMQRKHLGMQ